MAPRLRILAGTSLNEMVPITTIVNTEKPHRLVSNLFEGEIVAHIKGLTDENGKVRDSAYFAQKDRENVTWSIQVQGRFLIPFSSDDIMFGNTFDRPLKLPWGTSAVLKFMNYVDPTLEHDLTSQSKPWALSPLISTMPHFSHAHLEDDHRQAAQFPPREPMSDSTTDLHLAVVSQGDQASSPSSSSSSLSSSSNSSHSSESSRASAKFKRVLGSSKTRTNMNADIYQEIKQIEGSSQRRSYFASPEHRRQIVFGPDDLVTTDFCYGFINFAPTLSLQLPGGLSFDLMRYWDGQPVRFVCCERKRGDDEGGDPWGRTFWCIAIEVVDESPAV